jgi:uncharacterized protein YjbJ (UPF0337 family)
MATVVGLFRDMNTAEQAINDLKAAGYDPSRVGVVTRSKGTTQEVVGDTGTHDAAAAAGIGAIEGAIVGGGLAALIATGVIASIPFVGPIVLAGALATPLGATALGAIVGGVTGAAAGGLLAGMGVPEEEAKYYQSAIGEGGILLTVDAQDDNDAANARNILRNAGAEDIEQRAGGVSTMTAGTTDITSTAAAPAYAETTTTTSGPHNVGADTAGGAVAGGVIGAAVGGPVGAAAGAALGGAAGAGAGKAANTADRNATYTDTASNWDNNATTTTTTGWDNNTPADKPAATAAGGAAAGAVAGAVVGGPVGAVAGAAIGAVTGAGAGAAVDAAEHRDTNTSTTTPGTAVDNAAYNIDVVAHDAGHELQKPLPDREQVGGAAQETWGNVKRGVGEAVSSPGLAASGEKDVVQGEEHRAEGDLRNEAGDTRP